ncbi:cytoplasm protein [Coprinopsis marcescibilis]|uniref:Cytoplasm protein n=1 Tax=Coprinopsis marcescibilis TaxID=230819 RepID=A0A5C3L3N5_COPMA|nr:cytoplasm protein [Coprinopsis marcescibilis]
MVMWDISIIFRETFVLEMVNNATFLSAILALDVTQANYKPYPGALSQTALNGTTHHAHAQSGNALLIDPQNISFLPTVTEMSNPQCQVDPYTAPSIEYQEFPPYDEKVASVYRYRQQQAVNLGSWFVHEKWMTPSPFLCAAGDAISEIDIAYGWGNTSAARSVLERHWDTFITESDFKYLSNVGINTVRLPIGYWNLGPDFVKGTDYENASEVYQNSWPRVVRTINLAGQYGLGVLVDLHGAPGSQNGQDHSGVSDGKANLFDDSHNVEKTMQVLDYLAKQFVHVNNVVGLQILNEPKYVDGLIDFYSNAIDTIRQADPDASRLPLYAHNGFDMKRFGPFIAGRKDFVVEDHHSYFVYTDQDRAQTATQHAEDIETNVASTLEEAANETRRELIIGEWSCALTPESLASDPNQTQARSDFCGVQVDCYTSHTSGWSFWSYMKEDCDDDPGWCFKSAVGTVLPKTFFSYHHTPAQTQNVALFNNTFMLNEAELPLMERREHASSPMARRFEAIALKRARDEGSNDVENKGYEDGKLTAQIFAAHNNSRLGFVNQYISDTIATLGSDIVPPVAEAAYTSGFLRGLSEAESGIQDGLHT